MSTPTNYQRVRDFVRGGPGYFRDSTPELVKVRAYGAAGLMAYMDRAEFLDHLDLLGFKIDNPSRGVWQLVLPDRPARGYA